MRRLQFVTRHFEKEPAMTWTFLERLRQWKPLTRNVVVGLIKIATGAVAGASPENELLIKCVGGAAEATAEQCFEALGSEQKHAVNDQLVPLLDAHGGLLDELEHGIDNPNASAEELTGRIREMLNQRPVLQTEFNRFAGELLEIGQVLHRIEEQVKTLDAKIHLEFREIHSRFDALATALSGFPTYLTATPLTTPAGQSEGEVQLITRQQACAASSNTLLLGTGGGARGEAQTRIHITNVAPSPPAPRVNQLWVPLCERNRQGPTVPFPTRPTTGRFLLLLAQPHGQVEWEHFSWKESGDSFCLRTSQGVERHHYDGGIQPATAFWCAARGRIDCDRERGLFRNLQEKDFWQVALANLNHLERAAMTIRRHLAPGHSAAHHKLMRRIDRALHEQPVFTLVAGTGVPTCGCPATAMLVMEVSDPGFHQDRSRSTSLYARHGVPEYWLVDVQTRELEVYRAPCKDTTQPTGFGYGEVNRLRDTDSVTPLAVWKTSISVADLLPMGR
jgi:hypothetical protein